MKLPEKITVDWVDNERLIEMYNQLIDYLKEREGEKCAVCHGPASEDHTECSKIDEPEAITLPKPEWWKEEHRVNKRAGYLEALEAASKAFGVIIKLED